MRLDRLWGWTHALGGKRRWRGASALALTGLLAACVQAPVYHAPSAQELLPQQFATAGAEPAYPNWPQKWWQVFGDPAMDALVAAAQAHNADLAQADAAIDLARASVAASRAQWWPQLNADARVGADQLSLNSENFANVPPQLAAKSRLNDYRVGLDASWELDVAGRLRHGVQAAGARLESAALGREDASLRVSAETVRLALDYRYWTLRQQVNQHVLQLQARALALTQLQGQAGEVGDAQVLEAQAAWQSAKASVPPLAAAAQADVAALGVVTALPLDEVQALLGAAPLQPKVPQAFSAALSSRVLLRRPDLRQAERDLAAATSDIGVAVADQYPRIDLLGQGGWDSIRANALLSRASHYWDIGPQLSLPLFNGGQVQAQIHASQAQRDAALASYRGKVLSALADVQTAMVRCQSDRERLAALGAVLAHVQAQLVHERERVRVGESGELDLIAADLRLHASEDAQLAAQQTLTQDVVAMIKAFGGP